MKKPENIEEYKKWLLKEQKIEITPNYKRYYDVTTDHALKEIFRSNFWQEIITHIPTSRQEYMLDKGYELFQKPEPPEIKIKPFDSTINKSFRKNVVNNKKWPNPPNSSGWVTPDNWYNSISDIIRTCFIVKYIDGVDFLCDRLKKIAKKNQLAFRKKYEARPNGYYAVHIYIGLTAEVPAEDWGTEKIALDLEIQITTQLQEVIRNLLHKYYEVQRSTNQSTKYPWQWKYRDDVFFANNLGHILQFIEGMILNVREKGVMK